jgi:hypothetical protein
LFSSLSFLRGIKINESFAFFERFFNGTLHIECLFWVIITWPINKRYSIIIKTNPTFKSVQCVSDADEFSFSSCENLTHEEGLRQEFLDFSCSGHSKFIFFWQFVHTQNGNNILERFVILEDFLDRSGNCIVSKNMMKNYCRPFTKHDGVQNSGSGVQRIDGGVNTEFSKSSRQHSGSIQVSECGSWGWICQIISRHINSLPIKERNLLRLK